MSPIGLQYARDPSRGQFVLLPTTSGMESFPQAAFLWPPYMQQNPGPLQTTPNFIFPSMSPQTSGPTQSYSAPIQLVGPNYLTENAASSTVCHHSQANGSRFLSISSNTRRTEQKKDDWLQQNILNKGYLTSNFDAATKTDKSKDDESIHSQSNVDLIGLNPLMPNEHSHILLNSTHSPSELLPMPMMAANYSNPLNTIPLTAPQMDEVNAMYKNSAMKVSGFSKTPEMQDVNIQTDTPMCSDDENSSLEVSSAEFISCNLLSSDKIKSLSNNYGGCTGALPKDGSTDSLQQYTGVYDLSKTNTSSETYVYENECASNRSANKNDSNNTVRTTVPPSATCSSDSSAIKDNPTPLLEMSGLELLSNISTGSFINHDSLKAVRVKQEPSENVENERRNEFLNNDEYDTSLTNLEMQYADTKEKNETNNFIKSSTLRSEKSLGGLNLLCALAEQRIQEEVERNNFNNKTKGTSPELKKKKHKHSKLKSNRQLRYYKEGQNKIKKERKGSDFKSDCDDVHDNLSSVFEKVDPYSKKSNKWPDPEDFFKAMESDMRMRLADITRQYRKKKKKLDEINKIKKRKKTSEYKFANISCKNPSFICFLDKFQPTSSNFSPSANETEIESLSIQNKNITDCAIETSEENEKTSTLLGDIIKFNTQRPSENIVLSENKRCKSKKKKKRQLIPTFKVDRITLESSSPITKSQQIIVIKEENKFALKIDKEIVLSNEHLYREETRVLTDMGGLFYAGILKPLQPPDVYAITLDGERGNKSHIMSREEIFKDTILEVVPTNIENVPTGTRLCAYWSQQYRCLYPGKAIDSDYTDVGSDFVSVEFDDGDSGRIRLQNIRYLLSDYPVVGTQV